MGDLIPSVSLFMEPINITSVYSLGPNLNSFEIFLTFIPWSYFFGSLLFSILFLETYEYFHCTRVTPSQIFKFFLFFSHGNQTVSTSTTIVKPYKRRSETKTNQKISKTNKIYKLYYHRDRKIYQLYYDRLWL